MLTSDFLFIIQWWTMLFIIGIVFLPASILIFSRFIDKGYIFSKILGVVIISYVVFILGILKLLPFEQTTILLVFVLFAILNIFLISRYPNILISLKSSLKIFLFEELIFFATLLFWSYVRTHQPDINGLEKFMDFGFVNSILRSTYFPPPDMWFTPHSINYYYFGHLVTAVLTKLSNIPSFITYNLMLAALFAFTFTASFSIGLNLFRKLKVDETSLRAPFVAGLLTAFLVSLAGNLHTIYLFFRSYNTDNPVPFWQLIFSPQTFPNAYWYPNATRFIYNTIHEFPVYSFVVSDLHGHVLGIPIVLTIIAVLLSLMFKFQISPIRQAQGKFQIILLSFLIAVAYMTNAWDGPIYFLLTALVISFLNLKSKILNLKYVVLVLIGSIIFALPFSLNFKTFVSGIGVICAPEFLTSIGKIGPFIFEADHCLRSPLWQLFILYGFFYFWIILFIKTVILRLKAEGSDIFILLLITLSTLLIIIPEFFYIKDIYPAHYRANTMFKLVYQSFILLSLSSGYIIMRLILNIKDQILKIQIKDKIFNFNYVFFIFSILFFILVILYPYFAISSYYGDLQKNKGLDGTLYLKNSYPNDYEAIVWLNKYINDQPVILEAQGDSYTNYARVSANTGLPTVLGWLVHEWLWRGSYDIPSPRIGDVKTLYETKDATIAKRLIDKYHIELIFIGNLEKEKYPDLQEEKFKKLGNLIFQSRTTKIYRTYFSPTTNNVSLNDGTRSIKR